MQVNVSSIGAHNDWMSNSANNVANINTNDFEASETTLDNENTEVVANSNQTQNRTDLAKELTNQISITKGVEANTQAIKTADKLIGSLLDMTI
ncbi:MAG: flagellar biosynthesis protein FlgE [Epsilonproteobacteria bacterium]|nr:flagellar biosynthesis protein FlgE [Campylobacterota bacterium]